MKSLKNILIGIIIISFNSIYSQLPNNSLFIMVDEAKDSISSDKRPYLRINHSIDNKKEDWSLQLYNAYAEDSSLSTFIYLLPNKIVKNYIEMGNAITMSQFKKQISSLNRTELLHMMRLNSYDTQYVYKNEIQPTRRHNIYLFFKSDLDNRYVECYELRLSVSRMSPVE